MARLLDLGADPCCVSAEGQPALHIACTGQALARTDAARILVEHGARVNQRDRDGDQPLHVAVTVGTPAVVAYLVSVPGIDLMARRDADSLTAEQIAKKNGRWSCVWTSAGALARAQPWAHARRRLGSGPHMDMCIFWGVFVAACRLTARGFK